MTKQNFQWPSKADRNNYFYKLHFRVTEAQHKAIQKMLDANPKLMKKFVALWKEIDFDSFVLGCDPEYVEWLEEEEFVVGEGEESVTFKRTRSPKNDVVKP